uniref:Immunoglobulin domain-containing protein n=1 Tax=Stegastes partitus TaxID=144197 RepID=A0A3B5APL0_9TELE
YRGLSTVLLCGYVSGVLSLVTVHQPPILAAALGQDVIMPCELQLSHDEDLEYKPVLYWDHLLHNSSNKLWAPSEMYKGRVQLLDDSRVSWNKSIVLQKVQWADSGRYQCKLSVTPKRKKSFRIKGNLTSLMVYGKYKVWSFLFQMFGHNKNFFFSLQAAFNDIDSTNKLH